MPPAPGRTDIYDKLTSILQLPEGQLAEMANIQREEGLRNRVADPTRPLFKECRELVLRKCAPEQRAEIEHLFAQGPFTELERLVTQTLLDVAQGVAKAELQNEPWQHHIAPLSGLTYEQTRVAVLEFLDTDVFNVSRESCLAFLDPILVSWNIDRKTFSIRIFLNPELSTVTEQRFAFLPVPTVAPPFVEPGFLAFLADPNLSANLTAEERQFLAALTFSGRRPTPLYYYRELQNLRDPLHFLPVTAANSASSSQAYRLGQPPSSA